MFELVTVWLFYDDSLKYSYISKFDKYITLDGWTDNEDIYDSRLEVFKPKGDIDIVSMSKDEYSNFVTQYSDKCIKMYSLQLGRIDPDSENRFGQDINISIPLTFIEYNDCTNYYDYYISNHTEMFVPPCAFQKKYRRALNVLGMTNFYETLTNEETLDNINNSDFGVQNNLAYSNYNDGCMESDLHMRPNVFSAFMLTCGQFLRKDFFKKYMKGRYKHE